VIEGGHEDLLEPHRREIAVLFCDLRGFTAFTSEVEPEEVLTVLAQYYDEIGGLLRDFDATIGPLAGDGGMAYFNDPVQCTDPAAKAVDLGLAMQSAVVTLAAEWRRRGHELSCGVGIASGYATLGLIGFEGKRDYGPVGSVVNRASRLCDNAEAGQILIDASIHRQLGERCRTELLAEMELKGFPRPVPVYLVATSA
jgi:class 3 adenylate cyclase